MKRLTVTFEPHREVQIEASATQQEVQEIATTIAPMERVALITQLRLLADMLDTEGLLVIPRQGIDAQNIRTGPLSPIRWQGHTGCTRSIDCPAANRDRALCVGDEGCAATSHFNGCPES